MEPSNKLKCITLFVMTLGSVSWGKSWSWAWWDRWYVLILLWLKGYILAQYFMLLAHYFMFSFIISCFYKVEKVRERLWLPVLLVSFVMLWEKTEFSRKTPRGLTWSSCLVFLIVYWVYKASTVHGLSLLTILASESLFNRWVSESRDTPWVCVIASYVLLFSLIISYFLI